MEVYIVFRDCIVEGEYSCGVFIQLRESTAAGVYIHLRESTVLGEYLLLRKTVVEVYIQ